MLAKQRILVLLSVMIAPDDRRKSRVACWSPDDGTVAHSALASALRGHAPDFTTVVRSYESNDFKKGIDVQKLVTMAPYLQVFVKLDPRGGFVSQADLTQALATLALDEPLRSLLEVSAQAAHMPPSEFLKACAYKTRVALSHLREKKRASDVPKKADACRGLAACQSRACAPQRVAGVVRHDQGRQGL